MTPSMKGLLKGLRYIARMFEDEKEPDMQIGHPTDVKHVAHIGWEGPSATTPSWMNEFKAPELIPESFESESKKPSSSGNPSEKQKQKGRRKYATGTTNSLVVSPSSIGAKKQSKRSMGKPQQQQTTIQGSGSGLPSPTGQSVIPKQSKQRKDKGTAGSGSGSGSGESAFVRPARTKEEDCSLQAVCPFTGLGTSKGR